MDPLIPDDPPSAQLLAHSVEDFLKQIETRDVAPITQSFDEKMQRLQESIKRYRSLKKEREKAEREVHQVKKALKIAESQLADQRRKVEQYTKTIESKKREQETIESRWQIASEVWKNLGLELTLIEGKEDQVPDSGDDPAKKTAATSHFHVADGTYQVVLSQLPVSDKSFRFKIKFQDQGFSVLEAESSVFSVPDLTRIESEAGSDCRLLVCLLRRHIVSKLSSH